MTNPREAGPTRKTVEPNEVKVGMNVRDSSSNVHGEVTEIEEDDTTIGFKVKRNGQDAGHFLFYKPGVIGYDRKRVITLED